MTLKLNPRPDAYGFLYGRLETEHGSHNINVLPPVAEWAGQTKLEGYSPDERDWIVYLDGVEFMRVRRRQDLDDIARRLPKP